MFKNPIASPSSSPKYSWPLGLQNAAGLFNMDTLPFKPDSFSAPTGELSFVPPIGQRSSPASRVKFGINRTSNGFKLGTQAQMMPRLTSTALHMKLKLAYQEKSSGMGVR